MLCRCGERYVALRTYRSGKPAILLKPSPHDHDARRNRRGTTTGPAFRQASIHTTLGTCPENEPCRFSDPVLARCEAGPAPAALRPRRADLCRECGVCGGWLGGPGAACVGGAGSWVGLFSL